MLVCTTQDTQLIRFTKSLLQNWNPITKRLLLIKDLRSLSKAFKTTESDIFNLSQIIIFTFRISSASNDVSFILNFICSLNIEWYVLSPSSKFAAILVDATDNAVLPSRRIEFKMSLYKYVFPLPPESPRKKQYCHKFSFLTAAIINSNVDFCSVFRFEIIYSATACCCSMSYCLLVLLTNISDGGGGRPYISHFPPLLIEECFWCFLK